MVTAVNSSHPIRAPFSQEEGIPAYIPVKPILPSPEWGLLHTIRNLDALGSESLELSMKEMDSVSKEVKALHEERAKKLKEAASRAQSAKFWSTLRKIGECVFSAISTILGISLVATGGGVLIGSILIASGMLSLANLVITESNGWEYIAKKLAQDDKELEKKLAWILPTTVGWIACAAAFGTAFFGNLPWASLSITQKALAIVQTATGISNGVVAIGTGVSQSEMLRARADMEEFKGTLSTEEQNLDNIVRATNETVESLSRSISTAQRVLESVTSARLAALKGD